MLKWSEIFVISFYKNMICNKYCLNLEDKNKEILKYWIIIRSYV